MCQFLSFSIDKEGKIYAILGKDREKVIAEGKDPDSHSFIAEYFNIDEDECWHFDLNISYEEFLEGLKTIQHIDRIKKCYDGGLPLEDMPTEYLLRISDWLQENKDLIIEAGKIRFASDRLFDIIFEPDKLDTDEWCGTKLVQLHHARNYEQLIDELKLNTNKRGWGTHYTFINDKAIKVAFVNPGGLINYIGVYHYIKPYHRINEEGKFEILKEYRVSLIPAIILEKE